MTHKKNLFRPLTIKSIEFKNRIWVSPMCQYSSRDGHPTDWHLVHLGSRAVGGAGLIMIEATAVSPEGRISPDDSGIWTDNHIEGFKRINDFIKAQGSVVGIQLAHAGRKASTFAPWLGRGVVPQVDGGWPTVGPSPIPFEDGFLPPREMSDKDIRKVKTDFETATERSLQAGVQVLEIHMAHGYLMHQFLSPLSNHRKDEYGGSLENRMRFPLEIAEAVRRKWPNDLPLFVRISATDWAEGPDGLKAVPGKRPSNSPPWDLPSWSLPSWNLPSWNLNESILFCRRLKEMGIDLIDCSSGGTLPNAQIPVGPGYQVPFSESIRKEADILTAAVGMIVQPDQAEAILADQKADAIFMGRELLRNPYWPLDTARYFGETVQKPKPYGRS